MAENYGCEVKCTAALAPWSNGIGERHNAVVTEMFEKLRADHDFSAFRDATLLKFACFAKNVLYKKDGFAPFQLVFGSNARLHTVLHIRAPALECRTTTEVISRQLSLLHASRKAFLEADCSSRIKKALSANVRSDEGPFCQGGTVFYKRNLDGQWRGPAKVIGHESSIVLVRHGGVVVRVHRTCLKHANADRQSSHVTEKNAVHRAISNQNPELEDSDFENCDGQQAQGSPIRPLETCQSIKTESPLHIPYGFDGQRIQAVVLSRGGKATGKYKNHWNIEYTEPVEISGQRDTVDIEKLDELCVNNNSIEENLPEWFLSPIWTILRGKIRRIRKLDPKKVYDVVPDNGQIYLTCRWVLTDKEGRKKARLVARGSQDPDMPSLVKDSPTCSKKAFRIVLTICAKNNWPSNALDVRTAFLQGLPLNREVFLKPSEDALDMAGKLWKMKKCVYGLVDAARHCYEKVKSVLVDLGCSYSPLDPCVFYLKSNSKLHGILSPHVDDFWWCGDSHFEAVVVRGVFERFDVKSSVKVPFKYLGFDVFMKKGVLVVDQSAYAKEILVLQPQFKDGPINATLMSNMRKLLGKLQWLAT